MILTLNTSDNNNIAPQSTIISETRNHFRGHDALNTCRASLVFPKQSAVSNP